MRQLLASSLGTLALFSVLAAVAFFYDRTQTGHWIGVADLNVKFEIYDSDLGTPIPNARIVVRNEKEGGLLYDGALEDCKAPFVLKTNAQGEATRLLRNTRCTGVESRLHFTNSQRAYFPMWELQVLADGFQTTNRISVPAEYFGKDESVGSGQFRLVIRIPLEKSFDAEGGIRLVPKLRLGTSLRKLCFADHCVSR
jgi:hypothetical protein